MKLRLLLLLAAVGSTLIAGPAAPSRGAEEPEPGHPTDPAPAGAKDDAKPTPEVKAKKKAGGNPEVKDPAVAPPPGATGVAKKTPKKKAASLDEQYVLDNLEKYLSPTKMEVLPDGRVKLSFDFSQKKEEHAGVFTPPVSKDTQNIFRWSLPSEYAWYGGTTTKAEDGRYYYGALRISQSGAAHLNAFFTDDVEAEIHFANGASTTQEQTVSVVYTSGSKSLGSNWGTQAVTFESGRMKSRKGTVENAAMAANVKAKIVVRNGVFEAHRDGRQKQTDKYSPRSFASGRIGFLWAGGIAGFVYRLEITGRLDAKKMADLIRKQRK